VTFPDAASLATPAGNGAIGAACETPTPAAKMKAATAIADAIRIIASPPVEYFHVCQSHNSEASSPFRNDANSKTIMNEPSDLFVRGNEQTVIFEFAAARRTRRAS
jgi:hypothetical protein